MGNWTGTIAVAKANGDDRESLDSGDPADFDMLELSEEAHKDLDGIALWPMMELEAGVATEMDMQSVLEADEVEEFVEFLEGYIDHRGQDTTTAAGAAALKGLLELARAAEQRENPIIFAF